MRTVHGTGFGAALVVAVVGALAGAPHAEAITITPNDNPTDLVNTLLGPGVTLVGTPQLNPGTATALVQQGTFTGGAAAVGIDSGIVLSSGDVGTFAGANDPTAETLGSGTIGSADDISTDLNLGGDSDLDLLANQGAGATRDANVLTFDFLVNGTTSADLYFNFVFASEEYLNFVGSGFNDVFGFYLDGTNIALVPGTTDPISINTINPTSNAAYYVNNVNNTNGYPVAGLPFRFDGRTVVMTAHATGLDPNVQHTISLKIADTGDGVLDSAVFLQAGTFSNTFTPPPIEVPEPAGLGAIALGALALFAARRR